MVVEDHVSWGTAVTDPLGYLKSWSDPLREIPQAWRLAVLSGYVVASAMWTYVYVRPQPAGFRRMAAALPVLAANLIAPLLIRPEQEVLLMIASVQTFGLSTLRVIPLWLEAVPLSIIPLHFQSNTASSNLITPGRVSGVRQNFTV
jgi:hypothetical protein